MWDERSQLGRGVAVEGVGQAEAATVASVTWREEPPWSVSCRNNGQHHPVREALSFSADLVKK
jgi:hypothetical protein